MLRDRLLLRLREMGDAPDHQRLAAEVLGIRGAPPELARKLVAQALVIEDRRDGWRRTGERLFRHAPSGAGVYLLKDAGGRVLYVGKALNIGRRLRTHFADRRWRSLKPEMSRAVDAEWFEVGSELEALLREAALIQKFQPVVNVQVNVHNSAHIGAPNPRRRAVPRALVRDVLVVVPSVDSEAVELVGARVDGAWMIQRTRRDGTELGVHSRCLWRFFQRRDPSSAESVPPLAPIVFSWLARRGASASRLDPHDAASTKVLGRRVAALLRDDRLFQERLEQW